MASMNICPPVPIPPPPGWKIYGSRHRENQIFLRKVWAAAWRLSRPQNTPKQSKPFKNYIFQFISVISPRPASISLPILKKSMGREMFDFRHCIHVGYVFGGIFLSLTPPFLGAFTVEAMAVRAPLSRHAISKTFRLRLFNTVWLLVSRDILTWAHSFQIWAKMATENV